MSRQPAVVKLFLCLYLCNHLTNSLVVFVKGQSFYSVCLCVQTFWHIAPKWVDQLGCGGTVVLFDVGTDPLKQYWDQLQVGLCHTQCGATCQANLRLCMKYFVRNTSQMAAYLDVPPARCGPHWPLWAIILSFLPQVVKGVTGQIFVRTNFRPLQFFFNCIIGVSQG